MTQADAAEIVLKEVRRPLHRQELSDEIIRRKLPVWGDGAPRKTPWESVGRAVTQEIVRRGASSRFEYVHGKGSGTFRLREGGSPGSEARAGATPPAANTQPSPSIRCSDAELLERIRRIGVDAEEFIREAVFRAIREAEIRALEEQHRRGYERFPVQPDEFVEMDPDAWDEL
jgi:hypothetical protein